MMEEQRSSLYQYAVQLNNEGVQDLIINNDERSAIAALSHSLQIFKKLIISTMAEDEPSLVLLGGGGGGGGDGTEDKEPISVLNHTITERVLTNWKPNDHHHFFLQEEQKDVDDECCPIFDRAIFIQEHQDEDIESCMSVVIFNIALIYQCKGTTTRRTPIVHAAASCGGGGDNARHNFIIKAAKLYEMALQLIGGGSSSCRTSVLIQLASLNNLIHIRMETANYKGVQDGLNILPSLPSEVFFFVKDEEEDSQFLQDLFFKLSLMKVPIVAAAA